MSFKTELKLEDNTYVLNAFSLNIKQTVDEVGRPSSDTKGGKIFIMLDSLDDATLMDWVTSDQKTMDGILTLFKTDEESKLKEIKFEKVTKVPFKFRLGSIEECDRMESKGKFEK